MTREPGSLSCVRVELDSSPAGFRVLLGMTSRENKESIPYEVIWREDTVQKNSYKSHSSWEERDICRASGQVLPFPCDCGILLLDMKFICLVSVRPHNIAPRAQGSFWWRDLGLHSMRKHVDVLP